MKITIEGKEVELPVLFDLSSERGVARRGNKILLDKGTILSVGAGNLKFRNADWVYDPQRGEIVGVK